MKGKTTIVVSMYNKNFEVLEIIDKLFFPSLLRNRNKNTGIIIIDDGSPLQKETGNLINKYMRSLLKAFCFVRFVRNPKNLGFAKSYNRAIKMVRTKYIMVVNDDLYFPHGSIKRLLNSLNEPANYGMVGPISNNKTLWTFQYTKQAPSIKSYAEEELKKLEKFSTWLSLIKQGERKTTSHYLCGFCFAAKTDFIKEFGGFDENYLFGGFEDTDLSRKIIQKYGNEKIAIIKDVFVGHGGPKGNSISLLQEPEKMAHFMMMNSIKYLKRWGIKEYLKVLVFGLIRQITGKLTISSELPNVKF